jgi:monofunctional biosynthetic peptidoglycan transglycosylase
LRKALKISLCVAGAAVLAVVALWWSNPDVGPLKERRCNLTIQVKDWKDRYHPFEVGPANPRWVYMAQISRYMRAAVVAGEDAKFYRHGGFDIQAMKAAALKDLEEGKFARGGSTITQQLAKNLYLSREKTVVRKLREAMIAYQLERTLTKKRILELYLNVVELGPDVYGVENGSRFYFGKGAQALNPKEAAFLAAMLPGPKVYNPYKNLRRVERRSRLILRNMMLAGFLDRHAYLSWKEAAVNVRGMERKLESITGEKQETVVPPEEAQEPELPPELPPEVAQQPEGQPAAAPAGEAEPPSVPGEAAPQPAASPSGGGPN